MRLSGLLFAACAGLALPTLLLAAGAELPTARYGWLLVVGFAMGYMIPAALDFLTHDSRAEARSQREQRDANSEMTRAHAAEVWARLEQPAEVAASEAEELEQAWRVALDRFFRAGDAAGGFSGGKLKDVVGSDGWPKLVHFYASAAGGNVLRDAGSSVGHVWGHGWGLDRVMLALAGGKLPRPDTPLPEVKPFVAPATQRRAPQKSATVIQGN